MLAALEWPPSLRDSRRSGGRVAVDCPGTGRDAEAAQDNAGKVKALGLVLAVPNEAEWAVTTGSTESCANLSQGRSPRRSQRLLRAALASTQTTCSSKRRTPLKGSRLCTQCRGGGMPLTGKGGGIGTTWASGGLHLTGSACLVVVEAPGPILP